MRFFNTVGPVVPADHYCLPPLPRLDLDKVLSLIGQKKYFVLHAPRQTGKTSCLLALVDFLNQSGAYRAVYANLEVAQSARENVGEAMQAMLSEIAHAANDTLGDRLMLDRRRSALDEAGPHGALRTLLAEWAAAAAKPAILMLDEVDALVGDTLIALLRQLRAGCTHRPDRFPQSVILCGVRDVRDYRIHSSTEKSIITGGSAFNIRAESLRLGDFSRSEMETLYSQHTEETGQVFQQDALERVWELSSGQPWVVNALAYETCFRQKEGRERSQPITAKMIENGAENLIQLRETHLDQLADKLKEDRVRRVMEPLLAGEELEQRASDDDIQYVIDLGLVRRDADGLEIANGIYREIIPRQLTLVTQVDLESRFQSAWYIASDGRLEVEKLLESFQQFFRENSESWGQRFQYQEAWPQLLVQAFLQRVVNGGGQIHREYGLGRGRTDLLVIWNDQRIVLELKVLHQSLERTVEQGLEQTAGYMDRCGGREGHLIIFDRHATRSWDEKIWRNEARSGNHTITIWGM